VKGSKRGGRSCFFAPHQLPHVHANHALSPFAEKKTKKSAEMGPGTQCRPKNLSAIRHSILGYLKYSFFNFFQLTSFGHTLWNVHGQKN
jgi:hypothetical protein